MNPHHPEPLAQSREAKGKSQLRSSVKPLERRHWQPWAAPSAKSLTPGGHLDGKMDLWAGEMADNQTEKKKRWTLGPFSKKETTELGTVALGSLWQEEHHEFEAKLGYTGRGVFCSVFSFKGTIEDEEGGGEKEGGKGEGGGRKRRNPIWILTVMFLAD